MSSTLSSQWGGGDMPQTPMYGAKVNSPVTTLSAAITTTDTIIPITTLSNLPPAPNLATLGTDENAEIVLYTGIDTPGSKITGVTRAFQGTAKAWPVGTVIMRVFTAYDHDTFRANVSDLYAATRQNLIKGIFGP